MWALCANTRTQTVSPCIDSSVNNVLLQTNPNFNQCLLEFIHILEHRLIAPLLHDPSEPVIDQKEVRAVGGPQTRRNKIWGFVLQQFDRFARRCAGALSRWNMNVSPATRLIAASTIVSKRCTSLAQTVLAQTAGIRFLCDLISSLLTFVVHFSAYFVCSVFPR